VRSTVSKNCAKCGLLFVSPVRNFENVILVACERKLFRDFWAIFVVANLPQKEVLYYITIYSLFLNSVEPRALTCLLKQSNPSAWSLLSWHPTNTHIRGRLSVFSKLFAFYRQGHDESLKLCQYKRFPWTVSVMIETKSCKLQEVGCEILVLPLLACAFLITVAFLFRIYFFN